MPTDLLDRVLAPRPPAFALLHRPGAGGPATLEVLVGDVSTARTLDELPLPGPSPAGDGDRHELLTVVPYRQIAERGFVGVDDGAPLVALAVAEQEVLPLAAAVARLPDAPIELSEGRFDVDDDAYADIVRRVLADEIGAGLGSNFVIKRAFVVDVPGYSLRDVLTLFRRLLEHESGTYWTFLVHTEHCTLVGATPERHVTVRDGVAVMNPISGTYRYPPGGPDLAGLTAFLADGKETAELYMVLDEELKMMSRICADGCRAVGPYLKEMGRLAHTEYLIEGATGDDPREILRETMFAPTVTGSPLESACRVIARYEPRGRRYYGGVLALLGRDAAGRRTLDSAIVIRTADVAADGRLEIAVGATLVRDSDPRSEVAETRAKAAALLSAPAGPVRAGFAGHPDVRAALARRNSGIAGFWLADPDVRGRVDPVLSGRKVLVVDAEDTFTAMLEQQLRSLGLAVVVRRFDEEHAFDDYDLTVLGPGPGDPREPADPRVAALAAGLDLLLAGRRPFLAVCLSHQVLSARLGLPVIRLRRPNQGVQRGIDLFGSRERVGFYNTFAAVSERDELVAPGVGTVRVGRDPADGQVYALRGPGFVSVQFHAESVLTRGGPRILATAVREVLGR